MGTEALWIPLVMSVVSAGASYADARSQRKKADRVAMESLQQSKQKQARADQINKNLTDDIANSNPQEETGGRLNEYLAQLGANNGQATSAVGPMGGESAAYAKDAAGAALGINAYGKDLAGTTAIIDGAGDQRRGENKTIFNGGLDLSLIGREQQGSDRVTDLKMKGIRSNPWLQALSAVASGVGSSYSGGGKGGGAGLGDAGAFTPSQYGGMADYATIPRLTTRRG